MSSRLTQAMRSSCRKKGLITHYARGEEAPGNNVSVLALSSVFPLHRHAAEPRLRSPDLLLLACHGQKEP